MNLVAFVGKEKETLGQVTALVNRMECEKIILIKDSKAETVPQNEKCSVIEVDTSRDIISLKKEIEIKLAPLMNKEFEVALSVASGSGKEHMALIAALLNIPVGIKLVAYTKEGINFLS